MRVPCRGAEHQSFGAVVAVDANRSLVRRTPVRVSSFSNAQRSEDEGVQTMVYITAVRLHAGTGHQHITHVWWLNSVDGVSKTMTVAGAVDWIDKGNRLQVGGEKGPVDVIVVREVGQPPYIRTRANITPTDNLLSLPRF